MTKFNYCTRTTTYDDNEFICLATSTYREWDTLDYFWDFQIDVDEVNEDYAKIVTEEQQHIIVAGETYKEDVEVILTDLLLNHQANCISLYVKDYIDLRLPTEFYCISDIMLIIDMVSHNTPDDIQITVAFDNCKRDFEFYA